MLDFLPLMKTYSAALTWCSFSQSYVPIVTWLISFNWWGLYLLVSVLPVTNSVFTFLGWLCFRTQFPCGALIVEVVVNRRYYVPPLCIPPFLWVLSFSSVICDIGGRRSWNLPMSWAWQIFFAIPKCIHWTWLFVPKWWSHLTPLSRQQYFSLLLMQALDPFLISWWVDIGVPWGSMTPSSSPHFPRGQLFLSPRRNWKVLNHLKCSHQSELCQLAHQWKH